MAGFLRKFDPLQECWVFFFLAAIVFGLGLKANISVSTVVVIYQFLTILMISFVGYFLIRNRSFWRTPSVLVGAGLFLFFLLKGVYLEYPGDPWEYFRLITFWQNKVSLPEIGYVYGRYVVDPPRFSFLFYWAQISFLPRDLWLMGLTVISACAQFLIFIQIYHLAKEFCKTPSQTLWMAFFGFLFTGVCNTNYFSYLSLSSNLLSLIFFYRALRVMIHFLKGQRRNCWILLPIVILIYFTHVQGLLLLAVAAFSLLLYGLYSGELPAVENYKYKKILRKSIFILAVLGSLVMVLIHADEFLQIWNWKNRQNIYFDTLAGPGILALALSFLWWKQMKLLWFLNIGPLILLILPVLSYPLFLYVIPQPIYGHRLLYLLPTGFIVYQVVFYILQNKSKQFLWTMALLILLSIHSKRPWFGRLEHFARPVPEELSLKTYEPIIFWLEKNRPQQIKTCRWATDQATNFMLTTYFAWTLHNPRIERLDEQFEKDFADENIESCGMIIRDWTIPHEIPISHTSNALHHWERNVSQPDFLTTEKMKTRVTELLAKGWKKTSLPADYLLIEPGS